MAEEKEVSYVDLVLAHLGAMLSKLSGDSSPHHDKVYFDDEGNMTCQTRFMCLYGKSPWKELKDLGISGKAMATISGIQGAHPMFDKKSRDITFHGRTSNDVATSFKFTPLGVPIACVEPKPKGDKVILNIDSEVLRASISVLQPFINKMKSFSDLTGITVEGKSMRATNMTAVCAVRVEETICKNPITLPPFLCEYLLTVREPFEATVYGNHIRIVFECGIVLTSPLVIEHVPSETKDAVSGEHDLILRVEETEKFRKEIARMKKFSSAFDIGISIADQTVRLYSEDAGIGKIDDLFSLDVVWADHAIEKSLVARVAADDFLAAFGAVDRFKIYPKAQRMRGYGRAKCNDEQETEIKITLWMPIRKEES